MELQPGSARAEEGGGVGAVVQGRGGRDRGAEWERREIKVCAGGLSDGGSGPDDPGPTRGQTG